MYELLHERFESGVNGIQYAGRSPEPKVVSRADSRYYSVWRSYIHLRVIVAPRLITISCIIARP